MTGAFLCCLLLAVGLPGGFERSRGEGQQVLTESGAYGFDVIECQRRDVAQPLAQVALGKPGLACELFYGESLTGECCANLCRDSPRKRPGLLHFP